MMKVWALIMILPFEGEYLEDIFETKEKAEIAKSDLLKNEYYDYEIRECEVK